MLAAVPIAKSSDGSWRGLNLTFYGFFSATGTTFGFALMLLLLASVGIPAMVSALLVVVVLLVCVPASRMSPELSNASETRLRSRARRSSRRSSCRCWCSLCARWRFLHRELPVLPIFAAAAIAYALGESIGRLACLSFGCCYGMPLRNANPAIARLFQKHNLVIHGSTKKAVYASGLDGEPLIPVQAITSAIFAVSGIVGVALFLAGHFRLAGLIPVIASWGWRACSEWLRADSSRYVEDLGLSNDGDLFRAVSGCLRLADACRHSGHAGSLRGICADCVLRRRSSPCSCSGSRCSSTTDAAGSRTHGCRSTWWLSGPDCVQGCRSVAVAAVRIFLPCRPGACAPGSHHSTASRLGLSQNWFPCSPCLRGEPALRTGTSRRTAFLSARLRRGTGCRCPRRLSR